MLVGQVRRILSITAVRAQAECLLSRLRHVGRGTGAAYSRRQGAVREEVNWARKRQAKAVGRRQGRKMVKRGGVRYLVGEMRPWGEGVYVLRGLDL